MIQVSIDVPPEFQNHPDANWNVQDLSEFLNSERFGRKERTAILLHEGTHMVYARECLRECGCEWFELDLYGPSVKYDAFTENFRQCQASVEGLPFTIEMNADPLMVAKHFIGPVYTGQKCSVISPKNNSGGWLAQTSGTSMTGSAGVPVSRAMFPG